MRRYFSAFWVIVTMLAVNMFVAGCGGGDKEVSASGTWKFFDPAGRQETMMLTDAGGAITGTSTGGATISGTRHDTSVDLNLQYPDNYNITLDVTMDGGTMTGTAGDSNGGTGTVTIVQQDTGGTDDDSTDAAPTVDITGSWVGQKPGGGGTFTLTFVQTGGSLTGSNSGGDPIAGTVSGNHANFVVTHSDGTDTISATVDGNTMTCLVVSSEGDTATVTATRQ
jgi:hypothetical protein